MQADGSGAVSEQPDQGSLRRARAAKVQLASDLKKTPGVQGFGIGMNASHKEYAVHVYVRDERAAKSVPKHKDGVDVCVDIVGSIAAT
jgi:hypothetical protein